jgi:hypothetical protein
VEERARHSGVDEGDRAKKGNGDGQCLLWRPGEAGGEEKRQGSGSGGATRRRSAAGPGPDSRAASQMTAAGSLARAGLTSSGRGKEERGAWADPGKETECAEPG